MVIRVSDRGFGSGPRKAAERGVHITHHGQPANGQINVHGISIDGANGAGDNLTALINNAETVYINRGQGCATIVAKASDNTRTNLTLSDATRGSSGVRASLEIPLFRLKAGISTNGFHDDDTPLARTLKRTMNELSVKKPIKVDGLLIAAENNSELERVLKEGKSTQSTQEGLRTTIKASLDGKEVDIILSDSNSANACNVIIAEYGIDAHLSVTKIQASDSTLVQTIKEAMHKLYIESLKQEPPKRQELRKLAEK